MGKQSFDSRIQCVALKMVLYLRPVGPIGNLFQAAAEQKWPA